MLPFFVLAGFDIVVLETCEVEVDRKNRLIMKIKSYCFAMTTLGSS